MRSSMASRALSGSAVTADEVAPGKWETRPPVETPKLPARFQRLPGDELGAARGIGLAMLAGIAMWAGVGFGAAALVARYF